VNKEAIAAAWAAEPEKIINNHAAGEVNSTFSPSMPVAVITCLGHVITVAAPDIIYEI
jgi:hypothetical protein